MKLDYGKPVKVFYANLLVLGIKLRVDSGKLFVEGNVDVLSPVYRGEIIKRKQHLVELLTPEPAPALTPYFGRLLRLDEVKQALGIAEQMQTRIDALPVNGGWLLSTAKF